MKFFINVISIKNQLNDEKTATDKKKFKQNDLNNKIQIDKTEWQSILIWSKKKIVFELHNSVGGKIWSDEWKNSNTFLASAADKIE